MEAAFGGRACALSVSVPMLQENQWTNQHEKTEGRQLNN